MADGKSRGLLAQLLEELNARRIRVVDLTTTLAPETPVIDLPPIFAPSPGLTLTEISRYDSRGPAWYWNVLTLGEHTGTHFDAPIHWITGKDLPDNATDTIAPHKFIGPACVIDVTADVKANPDFLLTPEQLQRAVVSALAGETLATIVSKVEAVGPKSFHMDLPLLENRFQFKRALEALRRQE